MSRCRRALCAGFVAALVASFGAVTIAPAGAATSVSTEIELRTALALPGTTDVVLANSIDLTDCTVGGGDLDRAGAVTIDGAGFTIRQTCPGERVLESSSGTLTLLDVTITGGSQTGSGGVFGGGVRAAGDLVLDHATVSGNSLSGDGVFGGGVHTAGTLIATDSTISDNAATATGSTTASAFGGGAYASSIQLDRTTLQNNQLSATSNTGAASSVAKGAGAFAEQSVSATGSTVDSNQATAQGLSVTAQGGGLFATDLTISTSSMTNNAVAATGDPAGSSVALGGGVRATGALALDRTSVSQNTANGVGAFGGGVEADGAITLTASHVDENTATSARGTFGAGVLGGGGQDATITDSSVDGNNATMTSDEIFRGVNGGGVALVADHADFAPIHPAAGTVRLVRSSVSANEVHATTAGQSQGSQALTIGAGIYADTITLDSSHVDANELHPSNTVSAVGWGGGVAAITSLTANESTLDRNVIAPDSAQGIADGGGAYVSGSIVLTDSTLQGNEALGDGASGSAGCGALLTSSAATLTRTSVSHNVASAPRISFAGGVCAEEATITASTLTANSATGPTAESIGGGAVIGNGEIRDTTISGNTVSGAMSHGGGVTQAPLTNIDTLGTLTFVNSTISGNQATGPASSAGGIDIPDRFGNLDPDFDAGTVSLVFTTVASNEAGSGANIGASESDAMVTSFASTISTPLGGGTNCAGVTPTDEGYTQVTDPSCGTTATPDPQLGALGDNGGPTETMLPRSTSPLLDVVPSGACLVRVNTDQRGISRPQGTACDVGAVERYVPPAPDPPAAPTTPNDGPTTAPAAVVAEPRFTG